MNNTNNLVEKAIAKALELHQGQTRKGDGEKPYIVHPLEVGFIAARYDIREDLLAAAILHDTVEDCGYQLEELEKEFGTRVKDLVAALSEDKSIKDWAERKAENLIRLAENQDAYYIKSADALANMQSLIAAIREEGSSVWNRFNATKLQKMGYFRVILDNTEQFLPRKHIEDYVSALKDLEYSDLLTTNNPLGFVVTGSQKCEEH